MYLSHTKETIKYMLNALEKINKKKSALIIQIEIIYNKSLTEISKSCKKKWFVESVCFFLLKS